MTHASHTTKRWMSVGLAGAVVLGTVVVAMGLGIPFAQARKEANAIAEVAAGAAEGTCVVAGIVTSVCPQKGINNALKAINEKILSPAFRIALIQSLLNLSQFVLNRLAYEAAVAIASGGPGQGSLFYEQEPADAFATLGLEIAGEAVGSLSNLASAELGIKFNICDPSISNRDIGLSLAIGIKQKYKPQKPKCDILKVGKNWEGFLTNAYQTFTDPQVLQDKVLSTFAQTLQPGKNELTASLRLNIAVDQQVSEQKLLQFLQQNEQDYKPVTDFFTGNIKTPSQTLQGKFEKALEQSTETGEQIRVGELANAGELIGGLALSTASTFVNALLSQLLDKVYSGLFDPQPRPDPFDHLSIARPDKKTAQERFASVIATNPIRTTAYNALTDFVVCTAEGIMNRWLNQCVMDVNFLAAVSRGNAGTAVTVQEAIDEGLLNGDWPLIAPDNKPANQDPFCYTYGYCYGNLVKLRKARVVPIGWELAALRNNVSTPATLQEIVDGFNDCTQDGTIGPASASDSQSQWCHLIDPNWVLKYPDSQCRAVGIGDIRVSKLAPGRTSECVDAPSCIGEDNDGNCVDGYGYCVQEKNVWRFRGNECPAQYASCLSFENTNTGDQGDFLVNTVDYSVCNQDNAGCRWVRTNKSFDDGDTVEETSDDSYEWLPEGETYATADYDDQNGDRLYLNNNVATCASSEAGCSQLYAFESGLYLNAVQNPSFEEDEDNDGVPDGWVILSGAASIDTAVFQYGDASVLTSVGTSTRLEQFVDVAQQNFYTFSTFLRASVTGSTVTVTLELLDENGVKVDAAGTSSGGDCQWNASSDSYEIIASPSQDEFERVECLFTVPQTVQQVRMLIFTPSTSSVYLDGVQLELGEDANIFAEGYSQSAVAQYYKVAPEYFGCSGSPNDPASCGDFATVCSAQDVGCNLYAPEDGDPAVPAIISGLDQCPSACVGYTTYKQEATDYESEAFPLYFIADSASACAAQYVGCDSYTNLASVEEGGEGVENYTSLRFCLSPDIADSSSAGTIPATYFTWEGSDNEGYQLSTWSLLESNYNGAKDTFDTSLFEETNPELAPCTHVLMSAENEVFCADSNAAMDDDVWSNEACDEHDDIFDNPDCREFFDTQGNIHYRQYSDTVSISAECTPYRKDSGNEDDCEDSGGFWTDQGFCRYYVLPQESAQCPSEQNGCREYTGGAGRNASTILSENFEGGTYEDFAIALGTSANVSVAISNESVATQGHSVLVVVTGSASDSRGIETLHLYLDSTNTDETYDEDDALTCTSNGGDVASGGCEISVDDETCTVLDGQESCGALTRSLVTGKTFVLDVWAKGSGNLAVAFVEDGGAGASHNFVDPGNDPLIPDDLGLSGAWQLYSLGPIDTSTGAFSAFDENAVLRFTTTESEQFYLDNITLKQVEENITLIRDSWVVPSTCDTAPNGAPSPQYYLGCEGYSDQNGNDVDLYQFSDLCSEEVVGCEGFYATSNSQSPYKEIYNARCVYSTDEDFSDGELVGTNTACVVDDITYCTIATGQGYCTFDVQGVFPSPLPTSTTFGIVYGPETVVVAGDTPVYIVAEDSFACSGSAMGCEELGSPTYNQDQSQVESFESAYYLNLPDDYGNILCDAEALFCEEWSSTKDGNFYFKDPLDKECEYKTGVTIENKSYVGWFRVGTSEPCDWNDTDASGDFDVDEDDSYLIAGSEFGVWKNGDAGYDNWVAACESTYDLCSEFIDVVDTGGGLNEEGQSYYFTNDDLLDEESLLDSQRCNGQVSQKFGCALFNNTTVSELSYNTSASYVVSTHADVFYGLEKNELVDPVSCTLSGGGEFTISAANAALAGSGTNVDVCRRRCAYTLDADDALTTDLAQEYNVPLFSDEDPHGWFERSCFVDSDCPALTTRLGEEVSGSCTDIQDVPNIQISSLPSYALPDDANEVLKVNRDRSCSAWLACESSRTSWNTGSNTYDTICDSINLCVEGQQQGDRAICSQWDEGEPEVLSAYKYSSRDVSWTGFEYSGVSIPNQLPVETYDQFNVEAQAVCVNSVDIPYPTATGDPSLPRACASFEDCPRISSESLTCTQDSDCTSEGYAACQESSGRCYVRCENNIQTDYRLVYNAGACDSTDSGSGNGGECTVGHCEETGVSCVDNGDCASGEACVVGYLQATGSVDCVNADCSCNPAGNDNFGYNDACLGARSSANIPTGRCDPVQFACVDQYDIAQRDPCVTNSTTRTCVPASTSTAGSCFNNRCLADIVDENGDAKADRLVIESAREQACRAYPEIDSPYPAQVVSAWRTFDDLAVAWDDEPAALPASAGATADDVVPTQPWSLPYAYLNGFQDSNVCGLDADGNVVDCLCSYNKAQYGGGTTHRYYDTSMGIVEIEDVAPGICSGGPFAGIPCQNDVDCSIAADDNPLTPDQTGSCSLVTRVDTLYGWNGYCIERDSSIQTMGSPEQENQACLSWLPVDQLTGATDLYAKYTSAGFAPQNEYYCAEVEVAYTVTTSDIACAEVQDQQCNDDDWSKFRNESDNSARIAADAYPNSFSAQDDGVAGIWCPDGFFAVMTGCGALDAANYCTDTDGDRDAPYFCVPKLSYKTQTDGSYDAGEPCLSPGGLEYEFDPPPHTENTRAAVVDAIDAGAPPDFYVDVEDVEDHWAGEDRPNIRVYVVQPDLFTTLYDIYDDCAVRGVVERIDEYTYSPYGGESDPSDVITARPDGTISCTPEQAGCCSPPDSDPAYKCGFRGLSNSNFIPDAACTTVAQVASKTLEEDEVFQSYNAAWTNRLWSQQSDPDFLFPYSLVGDDAEHLGYLYPTGVIPYGSAIDFRNLAELVDPEPPIIAMCSSGEDRVLPTVGLDCPPGYEAPVSGEDARATRAVSISDHDLTVGSEDSALDRLAQIFGRLYRIVQYTDEGYDDVRDLGPAITNAMFVDLEGVEEFAEVEIDEFETPELNAWIWDSRATALGNDAPDHVPVVISLGECQGTQCDEGRVGKFNVNEVDAGVVEGAGSKRATVSFFASADSEQMPIRRVVVDWGDDFTALTGDLPWPTGSQSGSIATNNFYKNHRGVNPVSNTEYCTSEADEFGATTQACSSSYIAFTHDYICSTGRLSNLQSAADRECDLDEDGRLLNSPCYGGETGLGDQYCVFQPRVHVMDNWGWCTGFCTAGEDETDGCFSGVTDVGPPEVGQNECNIQFCPSEGEAEGCLDISGGTVNPWINFDGYISILAE